MSNKSAISINDDQLKSASWKMMKKFLFVSAILFSANPAHADADCKKLTITGNSEYPPISWRDRERPNVITAVANDLVEMAMKDVGVTVDSVYTGPWVRAQLAAKTGEVDLIHTAYINEERKQYLLYTSTPFLMDPTVIFVKKGAGFPFKKKEDLVGLTGSTRRGESYGEDFDNFAKEKLKLDFDYHD
jgi:polar amino acid transport system substrate-binding protein